VETFASEKYLENKRGNLYFMVGNARSGKSTVCKQISRELSAVILTQDSFRLAVYDRDYHYDSEPAVFGHIDVAARAMLINGTNVLIDETNTLAWRREHWRGLGGIGFFVNTPVETCISRCNPENHGLIGAVRRMGKNLESFNPEDPKEKIARIYTNDGSVKILIPLESK
jgi:adenylylsulfate kinase-like enzyme